MEVISSFELDRTIISSGNREMISVRMIEEEYMMSNTDISIRMGLVDIEYTPTKSYSELQVDLPNHLSPDLVWS